MITVHKEGVLLEKTDQEFENVAVFNPAAIRDNGNVHIFYRAVRGENHSTLGYCLLNSPTKISERLNHPVLTPDHDYEIQGVEDPRIVKIDDTYFLTYTAYDQVNALGALATSKDLKNFEKKGIITPQITYNQFKHLVARKRNVNPKYFRFYSFYQERGELDKRLLLWDKNVMFFPEKINGEYAFLHRIRPGIQIVKFKRLSDLNEAFWLDYFDNFTHYIVLDPKYSHEASFIGGGCPPILTEEGWLMIYHSVEDTPLGYVYHACAALLDAEHPEREITRLRQPLFSPELEWEKSGYVNNVVFPTGIVQEGDCIYIYYGAADCKVGVASISLKELLQALIQSKNEIE